MVEGVGRRLDCRNGWLKYVALLKVDGCIRGWYYADGTGYEYTISALT